MADELPIRVMIVDDHYMVREGLKALLGKASDIEIVGEAADGREALSGCEVCEPDVILMDVVMPNLDGPTATGLIRQRWPNVQVIALSTFVDKDLAQAMMDAGALGYLLKDASPDKLFSAIREARRGRGTVDGPIYQVLTYSRDDDREVGSDLTPREREVLGLISEGLANKQIAKQLGLSTGTVRLHVSNILVKLGASNRTEAAMIAVQHGLST